MSERGEPVHTLCDQRVGTVVGHDDDGLPVVEWAHPRGRFDDCSCAWCTADGRDLSIEIMAIHAGTWTVVDVHSFPPVRVLPGSASQLIAEAKPYGGFLRDRPRQ